MRTKNSIEGDPISARTEHLRYGPPYREALRAARNRRGDEQEWVSYRRIHLTVTPTKRGRTPQQSLGILQALAGVGELEADAEQTSFRTLL